MPVVIEGINLPPAHATILLIIVVTTALVRAVTALVTAWNQRGRDRSTVEEAVEDKIADSAEPPPTAKDGASGE